MEAEEAAAEDKDQQEAGEDRFRSCSRWRALVRRVWEGAVREEGYRPVWRTEEGGEKASSFSAVLSSGFFSFHFVRFVRFLCSLARTDMHRSVVLPLLSFTRTLHSDLPPLLYSLFVVSLTQFSTSPRLS